MRLEASRREDALRQAQLDIVTVHAVAVLDDQPRTQHVLDEPRMQQVAVLDDQQRMRMQPVVASQDQQAHTEALAGSQAAATPGMEESEASTTVGGMLGEHGAATSRMEVHEASTTVGEHEAATTRMEEHEASTTAARHSTAASYVHNVVSVQVEHSAREERVTSKAGPARPRGLRPRNLNTM